MDYRDALGRIRAVVRRAHYLVPIDAAPAAQRAALREIAGLMAAPEADPEAIRRRIHQLHAAGRLDRVRKLSALGVLAASPLVHDLAEAARLAGQQELAALEDGGPHRDAGLASADRHRGVVAWLVGRPEVALEWFTRALEREHSAENLGNVLAALVRLGEQGEARAMLAELRAGLPEPIRSALAARVAEDEDLSALR